MTAQRVTIERLVAGGDAAKIAKLTKMSAQSPKDYWGTRNESRHRELIAARDKLKARVA